ncbi:DNA polymerase subunit beta [Archaeoglobales archaeon]|nr:MAG: DNA polymerase subunit beta [Archaeoglobales archaeon]
MKNPTKPLRLRDFIKVKDCFFSIVGYDHSKGVKSFLRYVPSPRGDRILERTRYRKLLHDEAVKYSTERDLYYNEELGIFLVPHEDIQKVYKPENKIKELLEGKFTDEELRKIVEFFSGIPTEKMGVTGSRLIDLKSEESDVDFVMYGDFWFIGREKIRNGIESGKLAEPSQEMWDFIYTKRKVNIPFDIFLLHERRKYHRAVLGSTYFDLLYVRDYNELGKSIPEWRGKRLEKTTIKGELLDDSLTFDYPACFPLSKTKVRAILCFTHTYVGQAIKGEEIEARGYVEEIGGERYLVVGTSREVTDEYILSLDLIEKNSLTKEYILWKKSIGLE